MNFKDDIERVVDDWQELIDDLDKTVPYWRIWAATIFTVVFALVIIKMKYIR